MSAQNFGLTCAFVGGAQGALGEAELMTDIRSTTLEPHHQHGYVSWKAVLAGAAIAVAVGAMLNLLGMALGAAAINPYDLTRGEAEGFTVGAGIWIAIANALALFVGGFIASRAARPLPSVNGWIRAIS